MLYFRYQNEIIMILHDIANAAINNDKDLVRKLFATGVNTYLARLYFSAFYPDHVNAQFLLSVESKCKCGNRAIKWNPDPICGQCSFSEAMKCIQYGPA